ncbi:tail tape measure protein [Enterobacter phage Mulvp2]|nr:tail tape measure protein [Enterobacter phage Mulvp2]
MAIGIEIALDPSQAVRGADQVDKALDGIADSADNAQKRVNNLSGNGGKNDSGLGGLITAGKAFLGLQVVQQMAQWGKAFIEVADNINLLQSRINLYTQSQAESNAVFAQLQAIANNAGTSLQDTANTFARFASAGKDMGVTNDQVLKLISNLQTMARVSGASSQEASAAIYQLSQSFASGRLQGDEFRSVSEQLPVVLDTLAKKLNVSRGELRQMATDGKLNSDVLLMLAGDFSDLDAQAAKLPRTVEQASAALLNNLGVAADALNDKLGISQGLAKSIDGVNQALEYWTKNLNGTATETDELNRVLITQNGTLQRQQEVYDGLSDKTSMYGKYLLDQINKQKAAIAETENQISAMQRLAGLAATLAADFKAIQQTPKAPKADPDAQKQIDNLKANVAYTEALAKGNYELAASSKLGSNATKEQVAAYAALLKQQTDFRAGQKATSEAESAAKREQKQLEQNQEANKKYIKTLTDKVNAGQFDVQRAKEQVAQAMLQGQSVEDLSASYLKSIQVQNQLTLQSKQAEAQSRLNADATDAQRQAVDAHVASLYKQEQAQKLAGQVSQISQSNQQTLNPVASGFSSTVSQAAQSMATLNEAQKAGVLVGKEYNDAVLQNNQAGMVSLINQLQAGQTAFTDFSAKMGSAAIGLAQFKVSAGDASFLDGFTASLSGLMQGYEGFANGATDLFSGFFASFTDGFANSIGQAVVGAEDLDEALKNVAQQAIAGLISGFIKLGIQYATNAALAATFGTAITATTAGLAATTAAAWAPAAALASLASFGANAAPAAAALTTTTGLATGLALVPGFANGGYISGAGTGTSDSIPARLSNGEYVMPARQTRQYRNELAAMRAGSYTGGSGSQMNVEVANYGNDKVQVQQMDDDRVRLIIGEEVPRINASEFNNPYSQTNKAYRSNYNAERKV